MSNRTYDNYLYKEYVRGEYSCCECGYLRNENHHPGIRCPKTGRCGSCGNDWPCEDHVVFLDEKTLKRVSRTSYVKK